MSFLDSLSRFDAFAKAQDDFRTKTVFGGFITLLFIGALSVFSFAEWLHYRQLGWLSEITVDTFVQDEVSLFLDLTFPHVSCLCLNMDISTANKYRQNNLLGPDFKLTRILNDGKSSETKRGTGSACEPCEVGSSECCNTCVDALSYFKKKGSEIADLSTIEQCRQEGWVSTLSESMQEGCRVRGILKVPKVDGEVHFAPGRSFDNGSHVHDVSPFGSHAFDFSHIIHEFSFGLSDLPNPIKDLKVDFKDESAVTYSYFLRLVPVSISYSSGKNTRGFQISATRHHRKNMGEASLPIVTFHYDFSAMVITKTQRRRPLSSFFSGLCAVVGGLYTISAIIDSIVFQAERNMRAKQGFGKVF